MKKESIWSYAPKFVWYIVIGFFVIAAIIVWAEKRFFPRPYTYSYAHVADFEVVTPELQREMENYRDNNNREGYERYNDDRDNGRDPSDRDREAAESYSFDHLA